MKISGENTLRPSNSSHTLDQTWDLLRILGRYRASLQKVLPGRSAPANLLRSLQIILNTFQLLKTSIQVRICITLERAGFLIP